jgi:hypothetical protein
MLICTSRLSFVREAGALQSGRSAAWLARLVRDQEVDGSNPFAPTILLQTLTRNFCLGAAGGLGLSLCRRRRHNVISQKEHTNR